MPSRPLRTEAWKVAAGRQNRSVAPSAWVEPVMWPPRISGRINRKQRPARLAAVSDSKVMRASYDARLGGIDAWLMVWTPSVHRMSGGISGFGRGDAATAKVGAVATGAGAESAQAVMIRTDSTVIEWRMTTTLDLGAHDHHRRAAAANDTRTATMRVERAATAGDGAAACRAGPIRSSPGLDGSPSPLWAVSWTAT